MNVCDEVFRGGWYVGPKRWFCKMALCHHERSSKLTGIWSCSIGQSACSIVNGWMFGKGGIEFWMAGLDECVRLIKF